jgi:pectinesterase
MRGAAIGGARATVRRVLAAVGGTALLGLAGAPGCDAGAAPRPLRPVDDSYTVSSRYDAYHAQYPQLRWPELRFQPGQRLRFDVRYKQVGDRELHLDVFLPDPAQATGDAIVLVHGGGWRSGNKSNWYPIANQLAQRGHAVFLPEFRLSAEAAYPAGLVDLTDAVLWVKSHAADYGVDAARVAIGGESTGGHMAALVAYTAERDLYKSRPGADTRVSALVDLDGILDLTTPLALQFENAAGDASPAALWLGGSMQHAARRWREASAAAYVGATSPPTLVIASGAPRFTAGAETVLPALRAHGIRGEKVDFPGTPHAFWLFDPYVTQVADAVDGFLRGRH